MRSSVPVLLVLLAAGLSACGQSSSATKFSGEDEAVAQVVEDLQRSGERRQADEICDDLLAQALQERIKSAGSTCAAEMKKAIEDADAFDLDVEDVTVSGSKATARVKGSDEGDDVMRTFEFAKEDGRWRIVSFGEAS